MILIIALATAVSHDPAKHRPATPQLLSDGVLTKDGLTALAGLTDRLPKADPFSKDVPTSTLAGKSWMMSLAFTQAATDNATNATWSYDPVSEILTLKYSPGSFAGGQGEQLAFREKGVGTYTGSNAFGVKARIKSFVQASRGVVFDTALGNGAKRRSYEQPSYEKQFHLPPAEAKSLVSGIVAIIAGETVGGTDGRVTSCTDDHDGATISDPVEVYSNTCVVHAHLSHVEFYDGRGRKVVSEWSEIRPTGAASDGPPPARRATEISRPTWVAKPTPDDVASSYPERAQRLGRDGRVTMACKATDDGGLEGCSITSEDPADMGFGQAALRLSRRFKMKPTTEGGELVGGGAVNVPLMFRAMP